jgi:RpiR family transcriptional regulator, carbohydrate utilization regulator
MINIFSHIRTQYHKLSPTQKGIADFVLNNANEVMLLSLGDLAAKCNTSETTILRFLRKLGLDSYQVFKVRIAQDSSNHTGQAIYEEIRIDDPLDQVRNKVILSTVNSIQDLGNLIQTEQISSLVDLIMKSNRILFFGVGASGAVAIDAYHKFLRLGLNVSYFNDTHFMHIACSHVDSNTAVVLISHSGETRDIIEASRLAKENKAKVVALTSYGHSTITKNADCVLLSSSNETRFRSDAMVSRILQLVIIDIIYVALVLKLGDTGIESVNKSRLAVAKQKI